MMNVWMAVSLGILGYILLIPGMYIITIIVDGILGKQKDSPSNWGLACGWPLIFAFLLIFFVFIICLGVYLTITKGVYEIKTEWESFNDQTSSL